MRPLGAVFLGAYVDSVGRRKGLIVTLAIMAAGTIIIAFTPGYATIGFAAPVIVVFGRLLQGFSAGVELGGVSVYLAEIAKPGSKGFTTSFQSASQQAAVFVAALIGYGVNRGPERRAIAGLGLAHPVPDRLPDRAADLRAARFARRRRRNSSPKRSTRRRRKSIAAVWRQSGPTVALGMLMVMLTTVSFYFITVYTPDFGKIAEPVGERRAAGDAAGRVGQFLLAADRRRAFRPRSADSPCCWRRAR